MPGTLLGSENTIGNKIILHTKAFRWTALDPAKRYNDYCLRMCHKEALFKIRLESRMDGFMCSPGKTDEIQSMASQCFGQYKSLKLSSAYK